MENSDIPTTPEEVEELVKKAPGPEEIKALTSEVTDGHDLEKTEKRTQLWKWVSIAMFLLVVLIAITTQFYDKQNALQNSKDNSRRAECRAVIAGNLQVAVGHGVSAGNRYSSLIGKLLEDTINRVGAEGFQELTPEIQAASKDLDAAFTEITKASLDEVNILTICKD